MNIILLGPPGSGKGTQAERLRNTLQLTHIATGDLFRENLKNKTELGLLAQGYMNAGKLVPDDVTVAMLRERMLRPDVSPNGILFDGFPRTIAQADALRDLLSSLGKQVDAVIHLVVSDEELVSRLSGRLICRECQTPFHQVNNPFQSCPFNKCEGQYLYQRDDDKPETVRARLQTFHQQTSPLIDYYSQAGLLRTVKGEDSVDNVTQAMLNALDRGQ